MAAKEPFKLLQDGRLYLVTMNKFTMLNHRDYCLERTSGPTQALFAVVCLSIFASNATDCQLPNALLNCGMIISVISLLSLLVVLSTITELRTGPMKNLECLALSLVMAYTLLVTLRLFSGSHEWPKWTCIGTGKYELPHYKLCHTE